MNNLSNHYETLNVSKDASQAEIRASYISLCKLFQTESVMIAELTTSYEALKNRQEAVLPPLPQLPELPSIKLNCRTDKQNISDLVEHRNRHLEAQDKQVKGSSFKVAAFAAIFIGIAMIGISLNHEALSRVQFFDLQGIFPTEYVRAQTAPNGQAFPETSAYLTGYELGNNTGISSLLVNNNKNDNDVYLKLVTHENKKVVRHVYIKAKSEFKIENLSTGTYEIQYMDLVAGLVGKSVVFSVEETKTLVGTKGSTLGVNLKTATNGVLKVESVSIDAFNSLASL
jgi:hypothetical protein